MNEGYGSLVVLRSDLIIDEVEKAVVGKRKILEKIMTAILAGGHILIEDIPGTGKTTMALAFSRAMRLKETRVHGSLTVEY